MNKYEKEILNQLISKYERSRTFTGSNQVNQQFSVSMTKLFPAYSDSAAFEVFKSVNTAAAALEQTGYITVKRQKNGVIISVSLNLAAAPDIYHALSRTPKKDTNRQLAALLNRYIGYNELLDRYCHDQLQRLAENKKILPFDGDFASFQNILEVLSKVMSVEKETYQRDFSSAVLHDSKAFEKIRSKVENILFSYGDFARKETLLEELNIVRNPGHVFFKGNAVIYLGTQAINLQQLNGDIGLSSSLLRMIERIEVKADKIITIENLTTFNAFNNSHFFAVYLGGYHNHDRRMFIQTMYAQNPNAKYYHFGDIDAGGFYILLHLRRKTGIPFEPYKMDIATLKENLDDTKKLTDNDKIRLRHLLDSEFGDTVSFMLENDCKLEQENLD